MKQTFRRYLISSAVSFLTGFCLAIIGDISSITPQSFSDGVFIGVVFVGIRAGIKAVIELFLTTQE